jgi:hypothetical protein
MEAPLGFMHLREAADLVGRKRCGASWYPFEKLGSYTVIAKLNPEAERVISWLAERCASGELACARFTDDGERATVDPGVWHSPAWRDYFIAGKVTLVVPLRNEKGKLSVDEKGNLTASTRGTFDIFVEREGLERLIAALSEPNVGLCSSSVNSDKSKKQPKRDIIKEALKTLFPPDGKPDSKLPPKTLMQRVEAKLEEQGRQDVRVTRDSLSRALGHRK